MQYTNRRGDEYFAFEGITKTGKPKYFASKKPTSNQAARVEVLPTGFEFYENPTNATVVIRRCRPTSLTAAERNLLSRLALEHSSLNCEVIIDGDSLVIYSSPSPKINPALEAMIPGFGKSLVGRSQFEPGFKFTLVNKEQRLFAISRYCYRSSMEGWLELHNRPVSLEPLAKRYLPHLGDESFFELY